MSRTQTQTRSPVPPPELATDTFEAPVTKERKVRADLEDKIPKPYLARALVAPSVENPNGTPGRDSKGKSVLQQHISFFDQNQDGIIYPWETFRGMRDIGFGLLQSIFLAIFFNVGLSYVTLPGWIPNPLFPIYVERIHKAKHGSGTYTFDNEGRFMPMNFENIFTKFGVSRPGYLTLDEVTRMTQANRNSYDFIGWLIVKGEWSLVSQLGADADGYLSKEVVRGVFDGSLFERLAEKKKEAAKAKWH